MHAHRNHETGGRGSCRAVNFRERHRPSGAAGASPSRDGRLHRIVVPLGCLVLIGLTLSPLGCKGKTEDENKGNGNEIGLPKPQARKHIPPKVRFTDITSQAGIDFVHNNGAFGLKLLPETMGSGVAFIDFDQDGLVDLLLVNSCPWPGKEGKGKPPTLALYRNKGQGKFENVTAECGLGVTMYGMGVTVGDYDNDGWPDLYITAVGGNRLFHNEDNGKGVRCFKDVTAAAGAINNADWQATGFFEHVAPVAFPSSAAFFDFDNDGLLDIFVCNYVEWSPKTDSGQRCTLQGEDRAFCPPRAFKGSQCVLYRNLGNGKFEDVSRKAGIHVTGEQGEATGKSLGLVIWDIDGDGYQDVIVANDTVRNFLFHNKGNGTFEERGIPAGVAFAEGTARGAMGIDVGEFRPGQFAAAIANFANEPVTFLRLDRPKDLLFSDIALIAGLAGPSRIVLKFGLFFFDFDLDGLLDLLIANGHLEPDIHVVQSDQSYKQPALLFWNTGDKKRAFELVTPAEAGPDLFQPIVGRGSAFADIDGDGTLDVVLTDNGGAARLLKNEGGTGNNWVRLQLEGDPKKKVNRDAIGAVVTLTAGGKTQTRHVSTARGYLSQSEFPITFGLGKTDKIDRVEIRWPGHAETQVIEKLQARKLHRIKQK